MITYAWQIWEADAIEVIDDWQILCFSYKWLGDKRTKVIGQDDFENYIPGVNNDKRVTEALRGLFDEADVVIAHNGDSFDQKKSQARMMVHNLPPPSPYKQIDTKKVAKKYGAFTSNKLDHLNKGFGFEGKIETGGFATWKGCLAGDPKSWRKMKRYNRKDVDELERLYLRLRPWIANHPSVSLADGRPDNCPKCGEGPMRRRGFYYTKVAKVVNYQCMNCLGYSKQRMTVKTAQHYVN